MTLRCNVAICSKGIQVGYPWWLCEESRPMVVKLTANPCGGTSCVCSFLPYKCGMVRY